MEGSDCVCDIYLLETSAQAIAGTATELVRRVCREELESSPTLEQEMAHVLRALPAFQYATLISEEHLRGSTCRHSSLGWPK